MGLIANLNMISFKHFIKSLLLTTLLITSSFASFSQCLTSGSISVSASGFEAGGSFTQAYVLVLDASDEIVEINASGSFSSLTADAYRIYAVNYEDATPVELVVGDNWADLVSNVGSYCLNIIGPYACDELVCSGSDLVSTASGFNSTGDYLEKYVVVNSAATIVSTNTNGTFSGLAVGEYTVYAVNTDDATLKAEIDDLGAWADITGSAACAQILGPKAISVQVCAFLPITLITFNGQLNESKKVDLYWSTASEVNNDYFTIERSKNGHLFSPILQQRGAGNSSNFLHYSDIDEEPLQGVSYYRLKQTDFDGQYTYSKIVTVNFTKNSFLIYPNPTTDGFITLEKLANVENIKVFDALGKLIKEYSNLKSSSLTMNLSAYKKGIYYLVITTKNNVTTEKISLQ
jgi:hypothetical protein